MLGSAPFRRTQFLPELILSSRRVPENYHRGGGGRNCGEPCARLRDGGASFHNVAHLPRGLRGRLLCYGQDHVFARIRICRCAKCEHEHDTCTSNRPAACATEPASCFHALIVIPVPKSCKFIWSDFRTEKRPLQPSQTNPSKENVPSADG